jgi:predicted nucleic acid-binding protein
MIRVTWDTSVIVSAILAYDRRETPLGRLFSALSAGHCDVVLTAFIIDETRSTLEKRWFRRQLGDRLAEALLGVVERRATIVPETVAVHGVAPHPRDDPVIAAALSGRVSFLVTGDRALRAIERHGGVEFLTPTEFAALLPDRNATG